MNFHEKEKNTGGTLRFFVILGMALSLTACASTAPDTAQDCIGTECNQMAIEELAGFSMLHPEYVPSYFAFDSTRFDAETRGVILSYSHRDAPRERLLISQRQIGSEATYQLEDYFPPEAIRQVLVGNAIAQYVQGVYMSGEFNPSISNQQIVWRAQGMEFSIAATLPNNTAEQILIQIAESMK